MSSVLVTGGTGFIGLHLVEGLLRRGRRVRAFAACTFGELCRSISRRVIDVADLLRLLDRRVDLREGRVRESSRVAVIPAVLRLVFRAAVAP